MSRTIYKAVGLAAILGIAVSVGGAQKAAAGVDVSINLGFPIPQEVILVPGGVYYVSDPGVNAFFYAGYWWAPRGGVWYRASDYSGGWVVVEPRYVPPSVIRVYQEPNYRVVYKEKGRPIPYGQWKGRGYSPPERTVERGVKSDDGGKAKMTTPAKQDGGKGKGKKGN